MRGAAVAERLRVGLLFGGRSVEHEVSLTSARGVARAFAATRCDCVPLGVTAEGRWLSPALSRAILAGDGARVEVARGRDDGRHLVFDPSYGGLVEIGEGAGPAPVALDVAFPLIHGHGGEDGRLQGALDLIGLPYVGSGVLASAAGMDKAHARTLFEARGLPVCPWRVYRRGLYAADPAAVERDVAGELGFPVFVKPSNGGSSVGVSRVDGPTGLREALGLAFAHDREAVVEQGLDAREIECAVLGNDAPEASGLGEIVPSREFYDYAAKYLDGTSQLLIPAPLDGATTEAVRTLALAAYRALGLRGLARVDFLLERSSARIWLNEVNTLPGFTPISMFPKLWEHAGIGYGRLVERLVELALER
jgi:D-alanine-D-alanine ligase